MIGWRPSPPALAPLFLKTIVWVYVMLRVLLVVGFGIGLFNPFPMRPLDPMACSWEPILSLPLVPIWPVILWFPILMLPALLRLVFTLMRGIALGNTMRMLPGPLSSLPSTPILPSPLSRLMVRPLRRLLCRPRTLGNLLKIHLGLSFMLRLLRLFVLLKFSSFTILLLSLFIFVLTILVLQTFRVGLLCRPPSLCCRRLSSLYIALCRLGFVLGIVISPPIQATPGTSYRIPFVPILWSLFPRVYIYIYIYTAFRSGL